MVIQLMSPITPHFLSNNILRWVLLPSAVFVTVNTLAVQSSHGYSHKSQHSVDRRTNLKLNTNCADIIKLRPQDQDKTICGILTVPESRKDLNSKLLGLPFVIYKALGKSPVSDPVLMLPGGPGLSPVMYAELDFGHPDIADNPVRQRRDMIVLNYRGTARTQPFDLDCHTPGYPPPMKPGDPFDSGATTIYPTKAEADIASQRCENDLRSRTDRFDMYTNDIVVEDLDDLRRLLGAKRKFNQWNLYGQSYGTQLAQHYMRNHPDSLRSVILDGPLPIDSDGVRENWVMGLAKTNQIFTECEVNPGCNAAYPKLRSRFMKYVINLWRHPTNFMGKPWRSENAIAAPEINVDTRLDPETRLKVPHLLSLIADGDLENANKLIPFADRLPPATKSYSPINGSGSAWSVICFEADPPQPITASFYGAGWPKNFSQYLIDKSTTTKDTIRQCRSWLGNKQASTTAKRLFVSNIPTLIGVGTADIQTPAINADRVAKLLLRSQTVLVTGAGHGLNQPDVGSAGPCWKRIETAYFDYPLKPVDRSCMPDPKKVVFE
jgi:pimeloyl-ACP methyl ester carboxylesterase